MMEAIWKRRNSEEGFTLVELLVVIAILGILAGVAVFAISGTTGQSKTAACKSDLVSVQTASDAFTAQSPTGAVAANVAALIPGYLRAPGPSTTNGYTITLVSGTATASPAGCVLS
jgi:general secretion pathway protein G